MPPMHVLLGVHAAGKTSVGIELATLGFRVFPEIALTLIEGLSSPKSAWDLDSSFDDAVMLKEFTRDDEVLRQSVERGAYQQDVGLFR